MGTSWPGEKEEEEDELGAEPALSRVLLFSSGTRCAHLHGHVVDVEAEGDALVEGQLGLPCGVDVDHLLGLDVALLVVDAGLDHAVPDGL